MTSDNTPGSEGMAIAALTHRAVGRAVAHKRRRYAELAEALLRNLARPSRGIGDYRTEVARYSMSIDDRIVVAPGANLSGLTNSGKGSPRIFRCR